MKPENREQYEKAVKKMVRKKQLNLILAIIVQLSSVLLIFYWFGWKLILVLFLWTWANNIMMKS